MAEGMRRASNDELERILRELGSHVAFGATPDVVATVASRVADKRRPAPVLLRRASATVLRPLMRPVWQRVAVATAAVIVLASGVLSFSPTARRAVADFLGLRGVRIHIVPSPPSPPFRSLGQGLNLGQRITLAEAKARVTYHVFVPTAADLGSPDEVYVLATTLGDQVSMVYRARAGMPNASETGAGLLVTEFRARIERAFIEKMVGPGSTVEAVRVNGHPGLWIAGSPHAIAYVGLDGQSLSDSVRLAGNVLVWEQGPVTIRIESQLSKAEALRIAQSVR